MISHAQVPTVLVMDDCFRVYFSTRNSLGKSQIALIDLDLDNPSKILRLHHSPILVPGKPGTFDEDGVMPGCVLQKENEIWLYYTGWNQKISTPYHNAIGIAVSKDAGYTFDRLFEGPILDRSPYEPYITATPKVIMDNNQYKMWYGSGTEWIKIEDKYESVYDIKFATSVDGISWDRSGQTCITSDCKLEALCTPSVVVEQDCYKMWYSYRDAVNFRDGQGSYRIGYAESRDGVAWTRMDKQAGIDLSATGWDSKMQCYPCVVKHDAQYYMFYNGNDFGRSGFGYAVRKI